MLPGIPKSEKHLRIAFLLDLLNIPDKHRLIDTLSGGQKRRVSLCVALIHKPALIILDEPTVGVDPLLRETIWKYMVHLCDNEARTIVITTHYIEEARAADVVAFLRDGHLLAEANPEDLMREFRLPTLETVFLKLCHSVEPKQGSDEYVGSGRDQEVEEKRGDGLDAKKKAIKDVKREVKREVVSRDLKECKIDEDTVSIEAKSSQMIPAYLM